MRIYSVDMETIRNNKAGLMLTLNGSLLIMESQIILDGTEQSKPNKFRQVCGD